MATLEEKEWIGKQLKNIITVEDFQAFTSELASKFYDGNYDKAEAAVLDAFNQVKGKFNSEGLWGLVQDHFYSDAFVSNVIDYLVETGDLGKKCVPAALRYVENTDITPERRAKVAEIVGKWGGENELKALAEQRTFLLKLMETDPEVWGAQKPAVAGITKALTLAQKDKPKKTIV